MSDDNRLVELMAEMLQEQRLLRVEMKEGLNYLREELKGQIVELRKELHITNTNVAKAIKGANQLPEVMERLKRLENAVFKQ